MSYSMLVGGAVRLPAERMAEYLGREVDPTKRKGWPGMLDDHGEACGPVEDFLRALPGRLITQAGSWLDIAVDPAGALRVHGVLVEDDFLDHGANLADAFRAAGDCGGEGALYLLEEQVPFCPQEPELCYVVRAAKGRSRVQHPSEEEQAEAIAGELFAPVLERMDALMAEAGFPPPPRPKAKKAAKPSATKNPTARAVRAAGGARGPTPTPPGGKGSHSKKAAPAKKAAASGRGAAAKKAKG